MQLKCYSMINIDRIKLGPFKRELSQERLQSLKMDIAENGLINPITVEELPYESLFHRFFGLRYYALTDGHHRVNAMRELGHKRIKAAVFTE